MNHVRPLRQTSEHHLRDVLREQIMGFRTTQMIYVAAKLGIADLLAARPRPVEELAAAAGAEPQALYRLLRGLASLGIFAVDAAGEVVLTPQAELLRSDVQGSLRDVALLYGEDWVWQAYGNMTHSVRTGAPAFTKTHGQPLYGYLHAHPRAAARFNAAMTGFSSHETAAILEAYDFSDVRSVVDIGGGHGALLAALLRAHPRMTGTLFDLPSVLAGAASVLGEMGIAERVRTVAGDFFDEAPAGADLYVMKSVLHNWDDADAQRILTTCRAAMACPNWWSISDAKWRKAATSAPIRESTSCSFNKKYPPAASSAHRTAPPIHAVGPTIKSKPPSLPNRTSFIAASFDRI